MPQHSYSDSAKIVLGSGALRSTALYQKLVQQQIVPDYDLNDTVYSIHEIFNQLQAWLWAQYQARLDIVMNPGWPANWVLCFQDPRRVTEFVLKHG